MPILPSSRHFDQSTLSHLLDVDPVVQRYRRFFALFTWSAVSEQVMQPSQPGKCPHPQSAEISALLVKINEGFAH